MAGEALGGVLPFPVRIVCGWSQDPRATLPSTLAVAVDIVHPHHHRMRERASARWSELHRTE